MFVSKRLNKQASNSQYGVARADHNMQRYLNLLVLGFGKKWDFVFLYVIFYVSEF